MHSYYTLISTAKLANSKFGSSEDLKNLVDCFDKSTKLRFRNQEEPSYIKFGGVRDKDTAFGIRSGQLKLPGQVLIYKSILAFSLDVSTEARSPLSSNLL